MKLWWAQEMCFIFLCTGKECRLIWAVVVWDNWQIQDQVQKWSYGNIREFLCSFVPRMYCEPSQNYFFGYRKSWDGESAYFSKGSGGYFDALIPEELKSIPDRCFPRYRNLGISYIVMRKKLLPFNVLSSFNLIIIQHTFLESWCCGTELCLYFMLDYECRCDL